MDMEEIQPRLTRFCRAKYKDDNAVITDICKMPGHAGFSYGFTVKSGDRSESWYIRLPPPNVQWKGTADVLRQVAILNALDETDVPHCTVKWSGDDLEWFGCPYFIVPLLEGEVLGVGLEPGRWADRMSEEQTRGLGRQIMTALAEIHRVDWEKKASYLGPPIPFDQDVLRWDRFLDRCAEPERFEHAAEVRRLLLEKYPEKTPIGVFHGDFQASNLFCSYDGNLLAVIDWELVGIGSTLNDVGWVATFSDEKAWSTEGSGRRMFLDPETLTSMYIDAYGAPLPDLRWFRALAGYKFAIISGFNLSLHRRGKRPDPLWEDMRFSIDTLMGRALELLQAI
ncbi:MAG: phosphotransferase family protein [Desulfobacterales bacterium]